MPKPNFDEQIEAIRKKEEEFRTKRARVESEKKAYEKQEREKRLFKVATVAEKWGLESPDQMETLLSHLVESDDGRRQLVSLGVRPTSQWPKGVVPIDEARNDEPQKEDATS